MTFEQLAFKRRSVRTFTDRPVEAGTLRKLLEITFTAPSSKSSRSTRIAVVTDRELLAKMGNMRPLGSSLIGGARAAFVIMGDESASDLWRINCSISATVLQFAAEELGLGSCWVQVDGRPHTDDPQGPTAEDYLHGIMPATASYRILCVVALGYPEREHRPHQTRPDDMEGVIFI